MTKKIKVAMYSRVSTDGQNPDGQESEMKEYAKNRGWEVAGIYRDKMSGTKASRPALDELMGDARKRKMDIVLVWRFDRFARSVSHLLQALEDAQELLDTAGKVLPVTLSHATLCAELDDGEAELLAALAEIARSAGRSVGS